MPFMFGGFGLIWLLWSLLPLIALVVALKALRAAENRSRPEGERLAALETRLQELTAQVRQLGERLASLEGRSGPQVTPADLEIDEAASSPSAAGPLAVDVVTSPAPPPAVDAPTAPPRSLDLEQRIGARWATWVGVVAILFAASFFLRWAFERDLIGPGLRVTLGVLLGVGLFGSGLSLGRRRDLPYLSEGLVGGGLGLLYLSIYAGYAFYDLLGQGPAFAAMSAVTAAGALTSVVTGRQTVAVLSVLGGLLTPVLLAGERHDERILLGYLFVLDLLVLAVARFRTWPALNWLAWAGTALLLAPGFLRDPEPPHVLGRLGLLTALFLLFLAVPVVREWSVRSRAGDIDLLLVVANAAGYFWAVHWTLEASYPDTRGLAALALAVLYAAVAAETRRRVPGDEAAALVHLGVADVFLTLGIALAIHGPWITLAWAAQGVVLLSVAPRVVGPVAVWGGVVALALAAGRVVFVDPHWYADLTPQLTPADLVHATVVACLVWGGALARRVRDDQVRILTPDGLRGLLWIAASLLCAALIWRETTGLWPALLLSVEVLVLGGLARWLREPRAPTFVVALPLVAAALLFRMFMEDQTLARAAASSLVNGAVLTRIAGCIAIGVAGAWLARSIAEDGARTVGHLLSATAAFALLMALSVGWTDYQNGLVRDALGARRRDLVEDIRWRTQVGLSVLWTLYAAGTLAWGFVMRTPAVRYGALGLFGIVIVKVFMADLAAVETVYRIISFLILGLVLLGVSFLYQKARGRVG